MRYLWILLLAAISAWAQATVDNSQAARTAPVKLSASEPGSCKLGDFYLNSNTSTLRWCSSTNTWTDVADAHYAAGGGTAQAQTVTLGPSVSSLVAGLQVRWLPHAANTAAAPTLSVNGLAATAITKCGATALVSNDLTTTAVAWAVYDGTRFELLNPQAVPCGKSATAGAADTVLSLSDHASTELSDTGGLVRGGASLTGSGAPLVDAAAGTAGLMPSGTVLPNPSLGTGYLSTTKTAGTTGTTANLIVALDSSGNVVNAATSATGILGIAVSTKTTGQAVEVATRGVVNCIADNTTVIGNLAIVGTETGGRCRDSGKTSSTAVPISTQIVGKFLSVATVGNAASLQLYGPGHFGAQVTTFIGARTGLDLGWVDADTISVAAGGCITPDGNPIGYAGGNITFSALDTGTRAVGVDYAAFLTAAGVKLTAISTYHAGGLIPATYTAANTCLLGYFHNGKAIELQMATAPTAALGSGAGSVDNGAHAYSVTFVNALGETQRGILRATATVVDKTANGKINLTAIPLGDAGTTSRKIYGSTAGGVLQYYIATISNNTATTYTVDVADTSLTVAAPLVNTTMATTGGIFQYSVTSNDKLNRTYPFRAVQDLAAGVPLPGMVRVGSIAYGIYEASHEDATSSAAGTSAYVTSRYGVVPWVSVEGWTAMSVLPQSGLRLPTWAEWLAAATYNPGSVTPAILNGNTMNGSSSDGGGYLAAPGAATTALAGTGAGALSNGVYKYWVTLTNAFGETTAGTVSATVTVVDYTTNGKVALSGIPVGALGTTARKLYRSLVGGTTGKLLYTLADNSTTTYEDNIADATITGNAAPPSWNTTGAQQGTTDPTTGGRTLTGTGPRTSGWAVATTRSWYSPAGLADLVGNVWEWVAQFFGGLKTSAPGSAVAWGYEGDYAYNFQGQAYNTATGGWTDGLPSLLIVGGRWSDGADAGVRHANAYGSPGYSSLIIGFRPAR